MTSFAYRILPPRAELWDTIGSGEVALLVRYLEHLQQLRANGSVRFVGREQNGDYSFMLVEAVDKAHADAIARSGPAVSEGLMRIEQHTFLVVFDGARAARETEP